MTKHEETMKKLERIQEAINALVEALSERASEDLEYEENPYCPAHPGETLYRREGPFGTFYSHGKEIAPGRWVNCTGSGWRMNKVEEQK